jgi:hypothetical protein
VWWNEARSAVSTAAGVYTTPEEFAAARQLPQLIDDQELDMAVARLVDFPPGRAALAAAN